MAMTPFRLLSAQPSMDGEEWDITGQIHQDQWYEDAYGQNPVPFQQPRSGNGRTLPFPWKPGVGLALFDTALAFDLLLDTSQYPAVISAEGSTPVNKTASTNVPQLPLQATTANTGGFIAPGTYLITFSADTTIGPIAEHFTTVVVPAGTNTNTITVTGIQWRAAATAIAAFVGPSVLSMIYQGVPSARYSGSVADGFGNDTTFTFTTLVADGLGMPDPSFDHFVVQQTEIIHGGLWGAAVTSVVSHLPNSTLNFPGAAWTSNMWVGYTLALYYRPGVAVQPILELGIAANTTDSLQIAGGSQFHAGDVVIMRSLPDHITATTIGDDLFINSFAPSGLTVNAEAGNLIQIIAGTGAGSAPKTIATNTATILTIRDTWDITPDATSEYIIISPVNKIDKTAAVANDGTVATYGLVATVPIYSGSAQSVLVQVATAGADGSYWPMRYQPWREIYVPAQNTAGSSGPELVTPNVAGVFTPDISYGLNRIILTADAALAAPINGPSGADSESYDLSVEQDATGGHNLTLDPSYKCTVNILGTASALTRSESTWRISAGISKLQSVLTDEAI